MHNIFKGIITGFVGLVIWVLFSIPMGIDAALEAPENPTFRFLMTLGFALMVLGPAIYIVVLPAVGWLKKRQARRVVEASPSS